MTNDLGLCHQIPDQLPHFLKHSAEVTPENDFAFFANVLLRSLLAYPAPDSLPVRNRITLPSTRSPQPS